jgi:hypothetical protein
MMYRFLADAVAVIHFGYVLCVVLGLVIVLVGRALGWQWVHNRWVRGIHLAMISIVVARAVIWTSCPLTWWERDLRELGGQVEKLDDGETRINYEGHRLGEFCHNVIHPEDVPEWNFNPPPWVYLTVYSLFGGLIIATLWFVPVRWRTQRPHSPGPPAPGCQVVRPEQQAAPPGPHQAGQKVASAG